MFNNLNFFGILIFILIVIIAYTYYTRANIFNQLVNGFYESDASFCKESELETFCIYIDNDVLSNGERACYILAKRDGEIIINEPCTLKLTLASTSYDTSAKYFIAQFKDIGDECAEVFPHMQKLQFYPQTGKIILHADDTVTFVGYKNGINTEMKNAV